MPIEGVDASYDRGTPAGFAAAGKRFFAGYVSPQSAKNITRAECDEFHAVGMAICLVWEWTAQRALDGEAAGHTDGVKARQQATALGFPTDRPIYWAADWDVGAAQLAGPVAGYARGFAAGVGGVALSGVYGGLRTVRYMLDHQLVGFAWQTYAWSGGVWDPRVNARQYDNGEHIAGGTVDLDRAETLDYGQWEPDMPLTKADADMVWSDDTIANPSWRADATKNPTVQAGYALYGTWNEAHAANSKADQILAGLAAAAKVQAATLAAIQALSTAAGNPDSAPIIAAIEEVGMKESTAMSALLARLAAAEQAAAVALAAPAA